jgi:GNAT superfamily N-acetyltransferase
MLNSVQIRPWRYGDELLLGAIGDGLSADTLTNRFLAGVPVLPAGYLRHIAQAPRDRWDAAIALLDGSAIGWAEAARYPDAPREAELAVVVVDAWQRRGVGTALVDQLLRQCLGAGIVMLHADVLVDNKASQALIRRAFGAPLSAVRDGHVLHYRLALTFPLAAVSAAS